VIKRDEETEKILKRKTCEELANMQLTRVIYDADENTLFNLQFEFSDGSVCPPELTYAVENQEHAFNMP